MKILKYQQWHLLALLILLAALYSFVDKEMLGGQYIGWSTTAWFALALAIPILHQVYVSLFWRSELYYNYLTQKFGSSAFKLFKIGFMVLFVSRLVSIIFLSIANQRSLHLDIIIAYIIACTLFLPVVYLLYSVKTYFGFDRAIGIDHFEPDKFKGQPLVNEGIFKYTSNGMYVYGLLVLYIPGFLLLSKAAILAALFNHVYIWMHYYFTERPDMKHIYG